MKLHISWLISLFTLLLSLQVQAKDVKDIHYTTLLPILTNLNKDEVKELENLIVEKLKDQKDFQYKTHEGFYTILRKQGKRLKEALYTPVVLKTVSEKLSVGSMIRIEVFEYLLGYEVTLDILSKDGKSLYTRKKKVNQKTINFLASVVNFWIQGYISATPYDATIVEIQEDTLLVDFPGKKEELFPNKQFVVVRHITDPTAEDPKLAERFEEIAYGVVTEINDEFFMGKILEEKPQYKISSTDYVKFQIFDEEIAEKNDDYKYRKHDLGNYRKYGRFSLLGSLTKVQGDKNSAEFVGAMGNLDFFLPGNTLLMLEFSKKIASNADKTNTDSRGSGSSLNDNSYKALLGYTLRPKSFKFISYLDFFGGWSVDQNYLSGLGILGVGDVYFEGPVVGLRMEHPFYENLSGLSYLEYSIMPSFKEYKKSLGESKDASGYLIQLGMRYRFPRSGFCIDGLYRRKSNKTNFKNNNVELNIDNNQVMVGISNFF